MIETLREGETVTGPGAFRMPTRVYHADPCEEPSLSASIARLLVDQSPRHAWWAHPCLNPAWQPDDGSKRLSLGSACHQLLLGHGPELAVLDFDNYLTKAAKSERDHALEVGSVPILRAQHDQALAIVDAARLQLRGGDADEIGLRGDAEVACVVLDESGPWLRCLVDWWGDDRRNLYEYKTTVGSASPAAMTLAVARMGYAFQVAFYERVVEQLAPELAGRLRMRFVVQEIEPPYCLSVGELSQADLTVARRQVGAAIERWKRCRAEDRWDGYSAETQVIALPTWTHAGWLEREMIAEDGAAGDWVLAGGRLA